MKSDARLLKKLLEGQEQKKQPERKPRRRQRMPILARIGLTAGLSPFFAIAWQFNGRMSVEGLPALCTWASWAPPSWVMNSLWYAGWFLVIVTSIWQVLGAWRVWSRKAVPMWVAIPAFALSVYDMGTTGFGLRGRWWPDLPIDGAHTSQLVLLAIATLVLTNFVEVVVSWIWKGD